MQLTYIKCRQWPDGHSEICGLEISAMTVLGKKSKPVTPLPDAVPSVPLLAPPRLTDAASRHAQQIKSLPGTEPSARDPASWNASLSLPFGVFEYQRDVLERTILFFDTLRRRANNMLEHEDAGLPPLLNFKYEMLLDARLFARPANYALLRITEVGEDCWDDCVDPSKPPVIVLDPRAGHGPGIGGFKRESEVGIALHTGHPVYFVVFFPEPCPHQTLADVLAALRNFAETISARHGGTAPVLYGNCQAGWAATLLAAHCPDQIGPTVLNGSPLSYWEGEPGANPMRLMGGFVGGVWLTHFLADLNRDRFDGAWLVQNFESLKPGNAVWDKYANLFTKVDSESDRFLDFERWWNGFYRLSGEEVVSIVEDLFIGNKLEQGEIRIDEHCTIDLTRITRPLIIFASYGDNITPPHQALGWVPSVYKSTEALKKAGQRIVYLTNPHVGHLGIFVSASVARFEHRAILENLQEIEALEPGLFEMKISNPTGDPDCSRDQYSVEFVPRNVEDLRFDYPRAAFQKVREVSEFNETLYRTFMSPWVKAIANPWYAEAMHWLHPMRMRTYLWSERFMPWMGAFAVLADAVAKDRHGIRDDHPMMAQERKLIGEISAFWETARKLRDAAQERTFSNLYGE
jgi:pimeloyl-ACP methyl ester carboxylesterase